MFSKAKNHKTYASKGEKSVNPRPSNVIKPATVPTSGGTIAIKPSSGSGKKDTLKN